MSIYRLPADLPAPDHDGAAAHLLGHDVPSLVLDSSDGAFDLGAFAARLGVLYVYPATGVPGRPSLHAWDEIRDARGCTPQSCAFRDRVGESAEAGVRVAGFSAQSLAEQVRLARLRTRGER